MIIMKNSIKSYKIVVPVVLAVLLLFASSCDKEKIENRPDLPPVESLMMDFSDFSELPGGAAKGIVSTYDNAVHAYYSVLFWNTILTANLVVPVTAYGYALLQQPVYLGDNAWEWSYDFTILQMNYTATLTGKRINNETFSMKMVIALEALPNLGFTWFDGVVRYDHTHAEWNLYKNNDGTSVKVLEAVWNIDYETDESDLTYTYAEPLQNETGSYITMGIVAGSSYDAYYNISLTTGMTDIEWYRVTKAGRIMDPAYFEDNLWHCWNDLLEDIDCPVK